MARVQPIEKWRNIFDIFPTYMWFLVIAIGFVCGTLYHWMVQLYDAERHDYYNIMLTVLALTLGTSATIMMPKHSVLRVYILIMAIYGMLFVFVFGNVLLRVLTVTNAGIQIDTIEKIREQNFRLFGPSHFGGQQQCPPMDECLVALQDDYSLAILSSRQRANACELMWDVQLFCVPRNVIIYPVAMLVRSNFVHLSEVDELIMRFHESGLLQKWQGVGVVRVNEIAAEFEAEKLLLEHFAGAFVAIVAGLSYGTFVLFLELYVHKRVLLANGIGNPYPMSNWWHIMFFVAKLTPKRDQ